MADRPYHVASLLIGVVVWTGENDTKTISVDANLFENGAKELRFRLKADQCGRGLKKLAVVVHVPQTTQNLVISRCCIAEDGKEMYQEL